MKTQTNHDLSNMDETFTKFSINVISGKILEDTKIQATLEEPFLFQKVSKMNNSTFNSKKIKENKMACYKNVKCDIKPPQKHLDSRIIPRKTEQIEEESIYSKVFEESQSLNFMEDNTNNINEFKIVDGLTNDQTMELIPKKERRQLIQEQNNFKIFKPVKRIK